MTLDGAIAAVPQLGSACSHALTDDSPGSGIKILRLVNKQLRFAMLGVVRGHTLNLDGNGAGLLDKMTVLQGTKLSRLRVVVTRKPEGGMRAGIDSWAVHTLHLQRFISGMARAIKDVTHLDVTVHSVGVGSAQDLALLLSQLAPACPAVQQLQLTGDVGKGFLSALGVSCRQLSTLEVHEGVSIKSLQQLHISLPHLTHCEITAGDMLDDIHPPTTRPCCFAILLCTLLISLDVSTSLLTLPMWHALPVGLKRLRCSVDYHTPPAGLRVLQSLEHLCCVCIPAVNDIFMTNLVPILRVAPKLKTLMVSGHATYTDGSSLVSEVHLACQSSRIPDLIYLHDRVSSGLAVTSTLCAGGGAFPGLNLSVGFWRGAATSQEADAEYEDLAAYLAALPQFPAFTGLVLSSDEVQPRFASLVQAVAAGFPNLLALAFELYGAISSGELHHLGSLTALQHLSFQESEISPAALAMLCTRLPMLRMLRLEMCTGISVADGMSLQSALSGWGPTSQIVVVVLPEP